MKLDKETVVKHQFWFLLGGYLLVWIIAVFWLKFAAAGEINQVREAFDKTSKSLETERRSPVNTRTFVPPWEAYRNVFEKHKQVIWNQAWDFQRGMYDWPFGNNKDMSSPQTVLTDSEREEYKRTLYPDEIKQLREATKSILGPVELAGGFDAVFKPQEWKETPTREECWLAQEDYWVKRELLYVVGQAVAQESYMWPIGIDEKAEKMPEGVVSRHRYRNQNWELTFHIRRNAKKELVIAGDSTIKNVHPSGNPQSLTSAKGTGIGFNLMQDRTTALVEVRGEPVPWGEAQKLSTKDYEPIAGIDWAKYKEKPVYVSQSYDWPTCPVRRIEAIALGHQDSRTFTTTLQPNDTLVKLDPPEAAPEGDANKEANAAASGGAGGASGGMMGGSGSISPDMMQRMSQGSMGMMAGMKGGGAQGGNATPNNGIERNRYLQAPKKGDDPEKPSRHLPFAIALIVEQSHTHDVLAALANSRLRVQITQVDLHHAKGIKPEATDDKNGDFLRTGAVFMTGMSGGGPRGGKMPPMMGPGMMMPPMMGGAGSKMPPTMGSGMMPPMMGSGDGAPPMMSGSMRPPPGMMGSGNNTMMMMMSSMKGNRGNAPPGMMPPTGGGDRNRNLKLDADKKTAQIPEDDNLVEMTVYGIATLYRRPDPPKTDGQQSGQTTPAQTGQPVSSAPAPAAAPTGPAPAPGK